MSRLMKVSLLYVVICLLCSCLYVVVADANEIDPNPKKITIDIYAGCSIQKNISIKYTGDGPCYCNISTQVLPDSIGIDISYYPSDTFIIPKKSTYGLIMIINTSMLLIPQEYTILTYFDCYSYEPQNGNGGGKTVDQTIYLQPIPPIPPIITEQPEIIPFSPDETIEIGEPAKFLWYPYFIIIIIIILLITLIYLYSKSKGEKNK